MQSRFQIILTLAVIACFVCMSFARPVEESSIVQKIRSPRLNRRAELPDLQMKPYDTAGEPTREQALSANGGDLKYKFNSEYKETNPMKDGLTKMDDLNKQQAEKDKKKADKDKKKSE